MKNFISIFLISVISIFLLANITFANEENETDPPQIPEENPIGTNLIAHAGGGYKGIVYSNSLQALDNNYKAGFRFFEMDIEWTSDMELVMLHDWQKSFRALFNKKPKIYTLKDYKKLKMVKGLTQLTLDEAMKWFEQHPDTYLITDIKRGNYNRAMGIIKDRYPQLIKQVIPQVYYVNQYSTVKDMGFSNIIFTIYRLNLKDQEYIEAINKNNIGMLTIPTYKVSTEFVKKLKETGILLSVHTVNSKKVIEDYRKLGVDSFYTDFCTPQKK